MMKKQTTLLALILLAGDTARAQSVRGKDLIIASDNVQFNQLRVYDAAAGTGAQPLQILSTLGAGGVTGNSGGVATDGYLLAAVNFGAAQNPASQTVAVFKRVGDQLQLSQVIQALGQPVSVAFGNSHLYILSKTMVEGHFINNGSVSMTPDGSAVLALGDGSAAHLAVHTNRIDTAETSGVFGTVGLANGHITGPSQRVPLPPGTGANTPFGLAVSGETTYFTIAHSNLVGTIDGAGTVKEVSSSTENAPCWLAVEGPFLYSTNTASKSISLYLVTGGFIVQAIPVAARMAGGTLDIDARAGLVAVTDHTATTSEIASFAMDGQGNLSLMSLFTVAGNTTLNGVAIMQGGAPDLTITSSHTGSFIQGQAGATYTLEVSNVGPAATSGTVTVTEALPPGLVAGNITGSGWTCNQALLVCTRADSLASGASYGAIIVTVNVAPNAATLLTSAATVSGGGETNPANDTAVDITTVLQSGQAVTTTHIGMIAPEPGVVNQPYSVAYTVTSAAGTPAGNVTVSDGAGAQCTASAAAGACSLISISVGVKTITANFTGNAAFGSSSNTASHLVNTAPGVLPSASHSYDLTRSLIDSLGGPALTSNGGSVLASGYTFARGQGLSGAGLLSNQGTYTIAIRVAFNFSSNFTKIVDFKNLTEDNGLYYDTAHQLDLYPYASSGSPSANSNSFHTVTLTRDSSTGTVRTYLDGTQYGGDIVDTIFGVFAADAPIRFFMDDTISAVEASAGTATSIQIWGSALTPAQVALIGMSAPDYNYDLTSGLASLQGGASLLANGGSVSPSGYSFARGQGLTAIGLLSNPGTYTISMRVEFNFGP